jgi:uncharacterized protein YunC (DUF1805 family)
MTAKKRKLKLPDVTPESIRAVVASYKEADGYLRAGASEKLLPHAVAVAVRVFDDPSAADVRALLDAFDGLDVSTAFSLRIQGLVFQTLARARIRKDRTFDDLIDAAVAEIRRLKRVRKT